MQTSTEILLSKDAFLNKLTVLDPELEMELVGDAYDFSINAHASQKRKSGEPFFVHPASVALLLAGMQLDTNTICAALIHDVVEDSPATLDDVRDRFGEEITMLVDGVTKLVDLKFQSREVRQADNFRKLLISMIRDIRVILIKFADRLHNMRTLDFMANKHQLKIAQETRDIYAPLAHRLGIAKYKWELEDLAFKYLETEEYQSILERIDLKRDEREAHINEVITAIRKKFENSNIKVHVTGRPKHFYSIFRKMRDRQVPFEEIYDLFAIRVISENVENCYHVLGSVHSLWRPVQDRFKDYIANPKSNMYQSLHTTIVGPKGLFVEIQIRTAEMDKTAEIGIAAHWQYKEVKKGGPRLYDKYVTWIREIMDSQKEHGDPRIFIEDFKKDLLREEVFVFTPRGDIRALPAGATPIDFAFAIHTEIGQHCVGAKVNGQIKPLAYKLKNGDMVEVFASPSQKPSQDWLSTVKSPKARSKIRQFLRAEKFDQSVNIGRQIFEREAKRYKFKTQYDRKFLDRLKEAGFDRLDGFFEAIGRGELSASFYFTKFHEKEIPKIKSKMTRMVSRAVGSRGIRVKGLDKLMVRMAECCTPVPGDKIIGYITRGRGVSVHRIECPNIFPLLQKEKERTVEVVWDISGSELFPVTIEIIARDRQHLLLDISKVISDVGINIAGARFDAKGDEAVGRVEIEVNNLAQLRKITNSISRIKGIISVFRIEKDKIERDS